MTNFEKAKEFVEIHKKEIALTALAAVAAGVSIVLCKKVSFPKTCDVSLPKKIRDLDIPENLKTCNITALWREGDYVNSIIEHVCLSQMGEFGVELIDNLDCIEPDVPVDLIIGFCVK